MSLIAFVNNRGGVDLLSPQRIRNDLMNLANSEVTEVEEFEFDDTENELLSSIIGKLGLSKTIVSADDIKDAIADQVDGDKISVLFSLSRQHFLAMAYLIHTGGIDAAGILRLINLDYRTRTQALLELIPEPESTSETNLILDGFVRETADLFFPSNQRESKPMDFSFFSPTGGGATVVDISRMIVPDIFFTVYYAYWTKIYGSLSPDNWPITKINTDWVCGASRCNRTSARNNFFETEIYAKWRDNAKEKTSDTRTIKQRFPAFASYLEWRSDYQDETKNFSTQNMHTFLVNSLLPMSAIRAFYSRLSNKAAEWRGFPTSWSEEATKRGIWYGSEIGAQHHPNYFLFARWMHDNTDTVATSDRTLSYWGTFLTDSGNALRATVSSYSTASSDFTYINESELPRVRQFMAELFPAQSASLRLSNTYMSGILLNSRGVQQVAGSSKRYISTSTCRISYDSTVRSRIIQLSKFDVLANSSDSKVLSLGNQQVRDFAVKSLESALSAAGYSDQAILSLDSETAATTEINRIKGAVTSWILSQSPDASSPFYNRDLSESSANELNRIFLAEVVGDYFDYLLDTESDTFSPSLSAGLMKGYRLLNFMKHTFINFEDYISEIKSTQFYRQFVLMVLLSYNGINDRESVYSLITSRQIAEEDILNQLNQSPNTLFDSSYNNSAGEEGGNFGGGGGATGGGGSGVRIR